MNIKVINMVIISFFAIITISATNVPKQGAVPPPYSGPRGQDLKGENTYTVVKGDTLWGICKTELKDPYKWVAVWERNPHIKNPNWIYPKDKVTLDLDAPIKSSFVKKGNKEKYKDKRISRTFKFKDSGASKSTDKPLKTLKKEERGEIPIKKVDVVSQENEQQKRFQKLRLDAGFILEKKFKPIGQILKFDDEEMASINDVVYLNCGKDHNIQIGNSYLVFRRSYKVEHPVTFENLGYLINTIGKIKVVDVYDKTSKAVIEDQFATFNIGDNIINEYPKIRLSKENIKPDYNGYIVFIEQNKKIAGEGDFVYLDRGIKQGIKAGMFFDVLTPKQKVNDPDGGIKEIPSKIKGRIKVLNARENLSTGVIIDTDNNRNINNGDKITVE